jgi:alkylation response protein AidB-like acyl-CoA dehydrogenase
MIDLNDESIRAIVETASRFADRALREKESERDAYPYAPFAADAVAAAEEAGLFSLALPEDLGGSGLPGSSDDGLQKEFLGGSPPRLLAYPLYLLAEDLTATPGYREQDGRLVLKGGATLVANAPVAEAAVVAARDVQDVPALVLVPLPGGLRPPPAETLGLRSCPAGNLVLDGLALAPAHLLARGKDAVAALHREFLPAASAILLASLKASLDYALEYGRERHQGGRMIHQHGQLRSMYGQMAVEHAVLREAWLRSLESNESAESRIAVKALAGELALRGTTDGVQLLGGYGYTMDYPQERRMRDARQAAEILGSPVRMRLALIDGMMG